MKNGQTKGFKACSVQFWPIFWAISAPSEYWSLFRPNIRLFCQTLRKTPSFWVKLGSQIFQKICPWYREGILDGQCFFIIYTPPVFLTTVPKLSLIRSFSVQESKRSIDIISTSIVQNESWVLKIMMGKNKYW